MRWSSERSGAVVCFAGLDGAGGIGGGLYIAGLPCEGLFGQFTSTLT